ncbi:hypothetical protein DDK22_01200 [Cupriavidus necator]|uniref:PAN-3 domain-containing protein n=1 Tax=Cupriavidus necator TaxID=106590 RepID=A0A367PQV0_CUPNE|nr:hypothetical protein DDK22_01200 [Cupriavidus necator]
MLSPNFSLVRDSPKLTPSTCTRSWRGCASRCWSSRTCIAARQPATVNSETPGIS